MNRGAPGSGPKIAVLDYGIGNLRSAEKALQHVGAAARLVTDPAEVEAADAVVLPGVGAFGACARALRESELEPAARGAIAAGLPFLAVCIGFQLLYEGSDESPDAAGLGVFEGTVAPLPSTEKHPQMQWNQLDVVGDGAGGDGPAPLRGLGERPWVYFVHSYAPPVGPETVAVCDYGGPVAALVAQRNVWGAQFHPEKSGRCGLALLANFVALARVILYPAIDLRQGQAVRLTQGDFGRERRYGDPLTLAAQYIEGGATWIHVVDLNAARTGVAHERATLARIVELAAQAGPRVRVQTGGGIRSEDDVAAVLDLGVARAVLGTTALKDPVLTTRCMRRWPGQVAVGIDYSGASLEAGQAQTQGWEESSPLSIPEVLAQWHEEPLGAVVATSIVRDGMLEGPDLPGLRALLSRTPHPVIASGGVGTLEDLRALAALSAGGAEERGLAGVIVGKALVEERFSVQEAVAACAVSG